MKRIKSKRKIMNMADRTKPTIADQFLILILILLLIIFVILLLLLFVFFAAESHNLI
jgi:hypothetical protein